MKNLDPRTVDSFSDEWSRFDQSRLPGEEARKIFNEYFALFPWDRVTNNSTGFDMGCGTGRWARWVAPRVKRLHCIDPSDAIEIARSALVDFDNIDFHRASLDDELLPPCSQDFGYSIGVLHHVPRTGDAIFSCVRLLKPGAPLLLYLYYAFDNRPGWFRTLWRISNWLRRCVSALPRPVRDPITDLIALSVYLPLTVLSRALERLGFPVSGIPLSYYRHHSFYTMRTDARDRFGTPLEHRFTRDEIERMMSAAGLAGIRFSQSPPYWCAVGFRAN